MRKFIFRTIVDQEDEYVLFSVKVCIFVCKMSCWLLFARIIDVGSQSVMAKQINSNFNI